MPRPKPWTPAELVALDARPNPGAFARFRLDDGEFLTIDRVHYRLDGLVIQAIADTAGVESVEEGTGAFVKLRLDDDGMIREVADLDGRRRILLQRAA